MRKTNFNSTHPELKSGEVFLFNINADCDAFEAAGSFEEIQYKTKRVGSVAYDIKGDVLQNSLPIFVKRWEYNFRAVRRQNFPFISLFVFIFWLALMFNNPLIGYLASIIFPAGIVVLVAKIKSMHIASFHVVVRCIAALALGSIIVLVSDPIIQEHTILIFPNLLILGSSWFFSILLLLAKTKITESAGYV